MKLFLGFILGLIVATAGNLLAQSTGIFTDEHANIYQYGTMPGGSVNVWGQNGEHRTFFQAPQVNPKSPC